MAFKKIGLRLIAMLFLITALLLVVVLGCTISEGKTITVDDSGAGGPASGCHVSRPS